MATAADRQLEDMFSDAGTAAERGDRVEALKSAMDAAVARHDAKRDSFIMPSQVESGQRAGIIKGGRVDVAGLRAKATRAAEQVAKSLGPDEQNEVLAALREMQALQDDYMGKDITSTSPGNLHPYDLEAPAKQLVPRFTPLINDLPRQKGVGTAREYRRILGYTNTGMGGVSDLTPFFNSESDSGVPTFGSLNLRRGQKISYAMDIHTANYVEMSLSDMVTYKAQFANLGFENSRSLSMLALLWAHKLGEEKAALWGRGASGSGYEGAVAAPTVGTPVSGTAGSSGFGTTVFVKVTSYTGQGESLPFAEQTSSTLTAGSQLKIPITVQPTGAIAYGVYASTTTGTETFQGFFVPQSGFLVVPTFVSGGRVVPAADGSFNASGYDGFLSVLSDPAQAGYSTRFDVTYAGKSVYTAGGANNVGDQPWQDAFAALYASVYADPEEAWINVQQRRQLADFVRNAGSGAAAYRITIPEPDVNGVRIGAIVTGLHNESSPTDRMVALRVHPYMPTGASFIRSVHLDIPNSGIGDTTEVTEVQPYMAVDWPEIQFTYDASTYWFGTLVHYAPKWSACILGLS